MLVERDDGIGLGGHFSDYPDTQPPSPPAPVTDAEAEEEFAKLSLPLTDDSTRPAEAFTRRLLRDRARYQERIAALEAELRVATSELANAVGPKAEGQVARSRALLAREVPDAKS